MEILADLPRTESEKLLTSLTEEDAFDLEKELANPGEARKLKERASAQITNVKSLLRAGGKQEDIDQLGVLLHGYAALQKLIS